MCCMQEVRRKGQGARFVGTSGRRYKLWWTGNDAGFGEIGILVKEKISGNVVEVRRKNDRVMAIVLTLGREVMRIICAYGPQRADTEKVSFYDKMRSEWDFGSFSEITVSLEDFNGHVGKCAEDFEDVHGGNGIGKRNAEGRRLLEFCDDRELCVENTWFYKTDKKSLIVLVDVKQKLILRLREKTQNACGRKIQKVCEGCENDSMGTLSQAGGRRSG